MGTLTAKQRKAIPSSDYGLPDQRKYPMPDKAHARNAIARAEQQYEAGHLTLAQRLKIDAKAHKILGDTKN